MDNISDDSSQQYAVVAHAIDFIRAQALRQPSLAEIAAAVGMSEYHFQRMFTRWAGVSPKRFLQFLTKERAKLALRESADVLDATLAAGLSAPSRLHDLLVTCEAVTPGEYKSQGAGVIIEYGRGMTPFGPALIGSTARGICYFEFCADDPDQDVHDLRGSWAHATLVHEPARAQRLVGQIFPERPQPGRLHLLLKGTNFQIRIWEALLRTAPGQVLSYTQLAKLAGQDKAQRAVGSAMAANTLGYLIPCHRVIREGGELGSYRWGITRKTALLAWEAARAEAIASAAASDQPIGERWTGQRGVC